MPEGNAPVPQAGLPSCALVIADQEDDAATDLDTDGEAGDMLESGDSGDTQGWEEERRRPSQASLAEARQWYGPCGECGVAPCAWEEAARVWGDHGPVREGWRVCGVCGLCLEWAEWMGLLPGWYSPAWIYSLLLQRPGWAHLAPFDAENSFVPSP
jgi:hypothetical protein